MELFCDLHASLGLTIMLVTHTRQLVSSGMRAIEMAEGRIVEASAVRASRLAANRTNRDARLTQLKSRRSDQNVL